MEMVQNLIALAPRQLDGETKSAKLICDMLKKNEVDFFEQKFSLDIPRTEKVSLEVDGESLADVCGCCFVGGKIKGKDNIISSLISSQKFIDQENINVNPACSEISASNHYFAPSIAVTHEGLKKILCGNKVEGEVIVEKVSHDTKNILVGNMKNPKQICFAHYDSIRSGAIDNASGVALMMKVIVEERELLDNTLFVFAAAEELSYDCPVYWGHGFRVFEEKYNNLFDEAESIFVIDCIGNGKANIISEGKYIKLGFPIKGIDRLQKKVSLVAADFEKLMNVYHSDLDDGRGMTMEYVLDAYILLLSKLKK